MPKLQQSQNRFFITVPANIVRLLKWKKGDNIELDTDLKGKLFFKKEEETSSNASSD